MQKAVFEKRIYNSSAFTEAMRDILDHLKDLRAAVRRKRVDGKFARKIMLVVSCVNGCRYCIYGHSRAALASGVSEDELHTLLTGDLGAFPKEETVALTFAQHYAESCEHPDPVAWQRLVDCYGFQTAQDILAYLRMITMGNLLGNTFDAMLSRLVGKPAPGSGFWSEAGVLIKALFVFPIRMLFHSTVDFFRERGSSSGISSV
jgi:AhpD family alkylhydroperoxidase